MEGNGRLCKRCGLASTALSASSLAPGHVSLSLATADDEAEMTDVCQRLNITGVSRCLLSYVLEKQVLKRQNNELTGGVARICCEEGHCWKLCHGTLTVDFRAGCSSCLMTNSFVTNVVLFERM